MARERESATTKTIRRQQLRDIVPLADSTIYEMEQRGEFPRRFALSPRCVADSPNHKPRVKPGVGRDPPPSGASRVSAERAGVRSRCQVGCS